MISWIARLATTIVNCRWTPKTANRSCIVTWRLNDAMVYEANFSSTSRRLRATGSSVLATPLGERRPCSQSCIESTDTFSKRANSFCVKLTDWRAEIANSGSGV